MASSTSRTSDVLIVGGGIVGASIDLRLAQAGLHVTILDRGEPGAGASSAAAGMLAPHGERVEPPVFADLCRASRNLYPRFAAEIEELSGHSVGYRNDGTLLVALDSEQEEELITIRREQGAQGFPLQRLAASEVHVRVSGISPLVRGGLFVPGDHWIDNERLMRGLLTACRRAGVRIEAGHAVRKFNASGSHVESVEVTGANASATGTLTAKTYVVAAGCWSGEVAALTGTNIPLVPCRGQMMEFEMNRELPWVVRAGIHYLVPRPEQRIVVGTTSEYVGFEAAVTGAGLRSILEGVARLAPLVGDLRFRRAWAGLRPDTRDHLPILGYGEIENLVFATGHFRNGILLAPITAEIVAEILVKGASSRPLEAYRPTRFKGSRALTIE